MIKKVLLVALIAAIAYCYWPRHPDLLGYRPREMAALQIQAMKQAGGKQWFAHGITYFKIYNDQYGFPPFAAVGIAMDMSRAISTYRSSADEMDKGEAVKPLTTAYESIKKETKKNFDPKIVAETEIKIWGLIAEDAKDEIVAAKIAEEFVLIHGGVPKQYLPTAQFFVTALKEAKTSAWPAAQQNLQKGLADLQRSGHAK